MKTLRLFSALATLPFVQGDHALHPLVHPPSSLLIHLQPPSRPTSMQIRTPHHLGSIMGWLHSIGIKYIPPIPPIRVLTCRDCRGRAPPQVSFKSLAYVRQVILQLLFHFSMEGFSGAQGQSPRYHAVRTQSQPHLDLQLLLAPAG